MRFLFVDPNQDLTIPLNVTKSMRAKNRGIGFLLCASLTFGAACGGKNKSASTTPTQPAAAQPQRGPGGYDAYNFGQGNTTNPEAPGSPSAPGEATEPTSTGPTGPGGADLSAEQKASMVRQHLVAGGGALRQHDADLAIREALAALNVDETNAEAMIILAHGYYYKQYDDKALAILEIAEKHAAGASHPVLWMLKGLLFERGDQDDKALEAYLRATQLRGDYLAAWTNLGSMYLGRKRYNDAVVVFEKLVQTQNNSPKHHTHLGAAYRGRSGEFVNDEAGRLALVQRAEQEFRTALAQNASYAPAHFNLGLLFLDAEGYPGITAIARYEAAMKHFNEYKRIMASKLDPQSPIEDYIAAADKGLKREQKREEQRKKKEEKERRKQAG